MEKWMEEFWGSSLFPWGKTEPLELSRQCGGSARGAMTSAGVPWCSVPTKVHVQKLH